jgi:dihydroxyacetone kinase-like predicted kinase
LWRVIFPQRDSDDDAETITIIGKKEKTEAAKEHLQKLIKELDNIVEVEMQVAQKHHKHFVQRRGQVRDQFGARVIFPQRDSDDDAETITIIGKKEKTEAAKEHLQKLIKELDNIVEVEMQVAQKHHKHFVQRRGQVRDQFGARHR